MKQIRILKAIKEETEDGGRLSFEIQVGERTQTLWYEVSKEYAPYLCEEVVDGAVVTMLPYAMRGGYNIASEVPMSRALYYRLTEQLIPQLAICRGAVCAPEICAESIVPDYTPTGVATAISCGVDSFTTLYEYTQLCQFPEYRLTHLTFFENGAHHKGQFEYKEEHRKVFDGQLAHVRKFCEKYNYNLIGVRSNVAQFLNEMFWVESFEKTHTYRNVGFALMLQKLLKIYYYSPAYTVEEFEVNMSKSVAAYEKFLLPNVSTESIVFYNSNRAWTRLEKLKMLVDFPQTYDHLLVCYAETENCGKCLKCIRTLIELDFLGALDMYAKSFNVEDYKRRRNWYMTRLYAKRKHDEFMQELVLYAKEHNIYIPLSCKINGVVQGLGYTAFLRLQKLKRKLCGK